MTINDAYKYAMLIRKQAKLYSNIRFVEVEAKMKEEGHTEADIKLVKDWINHWGSSKAKPKWVAK
jgi:hypothetical protein